MNIGSGAVSVNDLCRRIFETIQMVTDNFLESRYEGVSSACSGPSVRNSVREALNEYAWTSAGVNGRRTEGSKREYGVQLGRKCGRAVGDSACLQGPGCEF